MKTDLAHDALAQAQARHLASERRLSLIELRLRTAGQAIAVGLQALLGLAVLGAVGIVAAFVIDATRDQGLVIQPFSTPADFQARGLTGDVLAAHLVDKLGAIDAGAHSARAVTGYHAASADDMKLEIPQTGVSVDALRRYLRRWLGRDTLIGGDLVSGPEGVTVRVRVADAPAVAFAGRQGELETLLQGAAETVYARTQPHRYAAWLLAHGRRDEARTAFRAIILSGAPRDRIWARLGLGAIAIDSGDYAGGLAQTREAARLDPGMPLAYANLAVWELDSGLARQAGRDAATAQRLLQDGPSADIEPAAARQALVMSGVIEAEAHGDYAKAADRAAALTDPADPRPGPVLLRAELLARAGQVAAAERLLRDLGPDVSPFANDVRAPAITLPAARIAIAKGDWPAALAELRRVDALAATHPSPRVRALRDRLLEPLLTQAQAHAAP